MSSSERSPLVPYRLGPLELEIMEWMWWRPDGYRSVRDVFEALGDGRAYTTVMTVMSRLHDKGLLRRQRQGRAWAYRPTMSRDGYAAGCMCDALHIAEDRSDALARFLADLDSDERARLRRLVQGS